MDVKCYDMRFIRDTGDKTISLLSTMHKGANANGCSIVCYEAQTGMKSAGFKGRMGAKAGNIGYVEEQSPTLCAGIETHVCYGIDHVVTTGGKCTAQGPCWYENVCPTEKASGVHAVCYSIQGNVVDRSTAQSGNGWCKDVSHTLNTQDKHAVCYDARGNGMGGVYTNLDR